MSAPYDLLLSRLRGARPAKPRAGCARAHRAFCPAHQSDSSKSPSLSVAETADGVVLINCYHGCAALDVAAAAGFDASDLYPPRTSSASAAVAGGSGAWAPLIALADALETGVIDVMTGGDGWDALEAVTAFKAAVRAVMRAEAQKEGVA